MNYEFHVRFNGKGGEKPISLEIFPGDLPKIVEMMSLLGYTLADCRVDLVD